MKESLRLALVQSELYWESPSANLAMFEEKLAPLSDVDVVVLPEMFNTGFTMNTTEMSEPENFTTFKWMKLMSARLQSAITGSFIVRTGEGVFNRLYWVNPDGSFHHYDKRHLFRMASEDEHFSAGSERLILEYKGWRIAPFICYDLRFPVWSRNSVIDGKLEYDLAIYVANWPEPRSNAWTNLLVGRAMENSAYVCGVNRTGVDGVGVPYAGDSLACDPRGTYLVEPASEEGIFIAEMSMEALGTYRKKFPVHLDADQFSIKK
jgi:predicted amidohydrolase